MTELDFTFEQPSWMQVLSDIQPGQQLSAARFLTLLEEESQELAEEALQELENRGIGLDIGDLPKFYGSGTAAARLRREEKAAQTGDFSAEFDENSPLLLYLSEVEALPNAENVQQLAQRYAAGQEQLLSKITDAMLSTVVRMARDYAGHGVLLLDLIQEGNLGLWQGILTYRQGDFASHARWWIGQYLAKAVVLQARVSGLGLKMKQAMEDYRSVDERLLSELGRNPTLEEIAEALHMSVEEAETVAKTVESARLLQQVKPQEAPQEDEQEQQAVENTAYFQMRQRIAELLSGVEELDAKVLTLRFGLEGGLPLTAQQVGEKLDMPPQEVVRRETAALEFIRSQA